MSNPTINGQNLLDELNIQLGTLSNAFTVDQKLSFLNKGVDEVWGVIRSLDLDYFADSTQDTDATQDDYFMDLSPTVREYALPINCREPRFIECLTVGFEDRVFEYRKFDDPVFGVSRRMGTANNPAAGGGSVGASSGSIIGNYFYTILGNQFILAQYPETTLNIKLWYIAAIDALQDQNSLVPQMLWPFIMKVVDYAAMRAILSTQNLSLEQEWVEMWKDAIRVLAISAGPRTSTNAIFINDYSGQ